MSKAVSFLEDCAVELKDLAEYTDQLTQIFEPWRQGTWYTHASVGCLHVRPVLNMKQADGAAGANMNALRVRRSRSRGALVADRTVKFAMRCSGRTAKLFMMEIGVWPCGVFNWQDCRR